MVYTTALFAIHHDTGAAFRSGRAPTPQRADKDFAPFRAPTTSRSVPLYAPKATLTFLFPIILFLFLNSKQFDIKYFSRRIIFA